MPTESEAATVKLYVVDADNPVTVKLVLVRLFVIMVPFLKTVYFTGPQLPTFEGDQFSVVLVLVVPEAFSPVGTGGIIGASQPFTVTAALCADAPAASLAETVKLYVVEADRPETAKLVLLRLLAMVLPFSKTAYVAAPQLAPTVEADQLRLVLVPTVGEALSPVGTLGAAEQALVTGCQSAGTFGGSHPGSEVWLWIHLYVVPLNVTNVPAAYAVQGCHVGMVCAELTETTTSRRKAMPTSRRRFISCSLLWKRIRALLRATFICYIALEQALIAETQISRRLKIIMLYSRFVTIF